MTRLGKCVGLGLAALAALSQAGCGGGIGILDYGSNAAAKVGSILPFQAKPPTPVAVPTGPAQVEFCPQIDVLEGTSAVRVGGDANSSVRYQYSLGATARECILVNDQVAIKVGIDGRVLIGPAGAPGTFQVPLRFVVRRVGEEKPLVSRVYRVAVNVPAGDTQATFTQIAEPMLVPYTGPDVASDYSILVGFDTGASKPQAAPARRRRHR